MIKFNLYINKKSKEEILIPFLSRLKQEKTKTEYMITINGFIEYIQKDILEITSNHAEQWVEHLKQNSENGIIKYRTAIKKYRQVTSLYNYIKEHAKQFDLPNNYESPFSSTYMEEPEAKISYTKLPSIEEIDNTISMLKDKGDLKLLICILFAFKCMMTISEICNVKTDDLFQTADGDYYLHIKAQNTWKESRYCYLTEDIAGVLFNYLNSSYNNELLQNTYIITSKKGEQSNPQTLRKRLERSCNMYHIKFYTFNDLRNAGIALAFSNSGNAKLVASSIGVRTNAHINRLSSLKLERLNAADYINIEIKHT